MERTKKEKIGKRILNRSISYLVLLGSMFLLCYSVFQITNYVKVRNENNQLNQLIEQIKQENEDLKLLNSKLRDSDYVSFYVRENYQYSGNDNIIKIKDN